MTSAPAVLITIPLSHYCEKARWALDWVALPYQQQPHVPLLHRLATQRNEGGSVPLLVHGGRRFVDSAAILDYADQVGGGGLLYPREAERRQEVSALEQHFDAQLGPHTRRWAYGELLSQPKLLRSVWSRGVPRLEASLLPLITPLTRRLVRSTYKITPQSAQRLLERVWEIFTQVDQRLSDGRKYLTGERFTAADLTFAALAAPALFPVEYRGVLPALEAMSATMREQISRFRGTNAGQFALRLFSQERNGARPARTLLGVLPGH
jgi:glutathione S-transferase